MMRGNRPYSLNVGGRLFRLDEPKVMGIVNCTPDSFYREPEDASGTVADEMPDILDVGGYSTRPGHEDVPVEEEMRRLREFFESKDSERYAGCVVSVDTFRADVARMCVEEYGVHIINDVSGGADPDMFRTAAELRVPYVLTSNENMQSSVLTLIKKVQQLRDVGQNDIIIDPGFGFGKNLDENYEMMRRLDEFQILDLPLLVGISRKSMIQKVLGCNAREALNGTTVLNTIALTKGADILRVHDVKEAREAIKLVESLEFIV